MKKVHSVKASSPQLARKFTDIPNVGPAMAQDFVLLKLTNPQDLCGQSALRLYRRLGELKGTPQDPCVLDVLLAAITFMETGISHKWWFFTPARKRLLSLNKE